MKRNLIRNGIPILLLLLTLVAGVVLAADGLSLSWATVDGGGGISAGGRFQVRGTVGQPDAGLMEGGAFELRGGFWGGGAVPGGARALYLPLVIRR